MVIASAHRDLFNWAARMVAAEPTAKIEPKPNGKAKHANTPQAEWRWPAREGEPERRRRVSARRRKARDRDDQALLQAMRNSPKAQSAIGCRDRQRPGSSTVSALERLRADGLAEIRSRASGG